MTDSISEPFDNATIVVREYPADTVWRCEICSYDHVGSAPPDVCPECGVGPDYFRIATA